MKRIVIAGGGTGGHVYPALSIAQALMKIDSRLQIDFVGTETGFEAQIIPQSGFRLHFLKVGKLNLSGGIIEKLKTLLLLPLSMIQAFKLYLKLKPDFVLGVGGYASGPFVLISALMRTPSAIWEPNAYPGLTNRILARFVPLSFVVFDDAKKLLQSREVIRVGLPVREEIEKLGDELQSKTISSTDSKFHLLIFGGSQGARAINKSIFEYLKSEKEKLKDFEVVHQTGKLDFAEYQEKYKVLPFVTVKEYLNPMVDYYRNTDMIICRAGASTVAEVTALGKTTLFIPLPTAADNHQVKNAESLVQQGLALMIEQKNLTTSKLSEMIQAVKLDPEARKRNFQILRGLHVKNAAHVTAKRILEQQQ
ncbi:MAG: undecaprenyldiphospho-muramoylpentapeptide beta-N-acetylglucosaminyltransferase [Pseudobdellovibrionaceae bacterium]|jgi:UDP-N-acetylglucosamine--N-acetylmuramyl-(pentapeptide) pyrophosphoryl-undecaprenol N-acetylglucosamine transferase